MNSPGTGRNVVDVPPDVIARSRPSGHSVPIIRRRRKLIRERRYRDLVILAVAVGGAIAMLLGAIFAVSRSIDAGTAAGYHLVCPAANPNTFRSKPPECHWEK